MSKRVKASDFTSEVTKTFKLYTDEVLAEVNDAVKDVAEEGKNELKVAGTFNNRSGEYRKGWSVTFNKLRYGIEAIIHNKQYYLTHLLESGHAKWLWGRDTGEQVQAFPHIEKVNEEVQRRLEEEIERRLG